MRLPATTAPTVESIDTDVVPTGDAGDRRVPDTEDPSQADGSIAPDGPIAPTRRRVLGGIAGAAAAGLAGCSSLTGGGGGGGGDTGWAEWAPADLVDTDQPGAQAGKFEIDALREEFPSSYMEQSGFESTVQDLGLTLDDLDSVVTISEGEGSEHAVLLGSFAANTVLDNFRVEPSSTYEGYDVLVEELAIDDGVVVAGTAYQDIIDAKSGSATNLLEAEGEWPAVVENVSGGTIAVVEPADSGDPWELSGIAVTGDGSETLSMTAYAHFGSADAAASNRNAVKQDVKNPEEPGGATMTVDSVSVDGNVVIVEGTTPAREL